ncbi:MAG: Gldg family protein [Planctomycetia bacterium]|nr:Gldg family protein [Planctomycetia bacterium]
MNTNVIGAIFRRNFFSYFANPTGYVFICVYVLLSSFAAFWPNEFFNSNLANLDQLNKYLPYILLVFIPAITMSIWADERRQGTDELLLTIPANDFDVVIGKYLAAVAIFSVALVFSLFCNFVVLAWLGSPDVGLFLATYIGYWFVGLAMLSVGMVASFLTGNLTVGFVLGALFNAPLAFAASADVILPTQAALAVKGWSLESQFRDFGRGVISMAGVAFFLLIVASMLYLSMLLIGRRHWQGGRGSSLGTHYAVRAVALLLAAAGLVLIFQQRFDYRADISSERLSSLSPQTKKLVAQLDPKSPVKIDAYISPEVPEAYVQTRLNLLSALREFEALDRNKIDVTVHDTEPLSENAERAEQQFGINSRQVPSRSRGAFKVDDIYMGVAVTSGLNKVVVPFMDRGIPVEYELARSIATVSQQKRKRLGVLTTDARMFGGFDQQTFRPTPEEPLIEELKKQYEVVQVSPDAPIAERYDVLLAVQPSSLSQEQLNNFINCVRHGQPTAIFEDPFPFLARNVPATSAEKQPPGGMMGMQQRPMPKGNIQPLWDLLGVDFSARQVVWQEYNPFKKFLDFPDEFVFVDTGLGATKVFNPADPISSGLQMLLFVFPGSIQKLNSSPLTFEPLITTGHDTGTVAYDQILQPSFFGQGGGLNPYRKTQPTGQEYIIAARIHGKPKENPLDPSQDTDAAGDKESADKKPAEINVVLVSDIDPLFAEFFQLRARGQDIEGGFDLNVDDVTFVLNTLDGLAGDDRFIDIRKRRPQHRVLEQIERRMDKAREESIANRKQFNQEYDDAIAKANQDLNEAVKKVKEKKGLDDVARMTEEAIAQQHERSKLEQKSDALKKQRDAAIRKIDSDLAQQVSSVQNWYKLWAVVLPPILPMLVGLGVYFNRRAKEREGVARSRLRS